MSSLTHHFIAVGKFYWSFSIPTVETWLFVFCLSGMISIFNQFDHCYLSIFVNQYFHLMKCAVNMNVHWTLSFNWIEYDSLWSQYWWYFHNSNETDNLLAGKSSHIRWCEFYESSDEQKKNKMKLLFNFVHHLL